MILAEYFAFLPYGKYAFYIWLAYLITLLIIANLFMQTASIRKKIHAELRLKYIREDEKSR